MRILIAADVVPTKKTEQMFINQELDALFTDVREKLNGIDRLVINLECALTDSEVGIKKFGPCLKADPRCADTLKALGVTDVMLSNNHVFDYGIRGLKDTMENLERVGLPYTGVGENDELSRKPYIVEQGGKRIGFINVCEHEYTYALPDRMGANPYDPYLTMQDIRKLKSEVDCVIVLYHGGKELCRYPSPRLRLLCKEMVENGASAVITQHSHCIGCYENYKGAHIVYGQGNFHFCYPDLSNEYWETSLLVELNIGDGVDIDFIPIVTGESSIELAKGEKYDEIINAFNERNESLKNGKWRDGWHEFCISVKDGYIARANAEKNPDVFAHYLDCEAHTDVWRELFPTWNLTNEK